SPRLPRFRCRSIWRSGVRSPDFPGIPSWSRGTGDPMQTPGGPVSLLPLASASVLVVALALTAHYLLRRLRRLKRYAGAARRYRSRIALLRRRRRLSRLSAREAYCQRAREAAAPVFVTTPEGAIAAASKPAVDLLGYASEEELKRISIENVYVS